jgi:hypothetical protein
VWRGIWDLQDIYLFPDDLITSSLLSAAIGITFGTVAFFAQHVLNDTVKTVLVAVASISYWRGVWILWDELVWPQDPTLQSAAGLAVGSAVLLAAKSFRLGVASPPILHQNDQIYLLEDPFLGPAHAAFDVAHQEEEVLHGVDGVHDYHDHRERNLAEQVHHVWNRTEIIGALGALEQPGVPKDISRRSNQHHQEPQE